MADSNPKFNREAFKRALAHVESSGGKFLENSSSSAVGKYQFLWNNIKSDPLLKGVTKRQFIDSPELQEKIMDSALNGKLKGYPNYIENSRKLQEQYGSSLRVDEIALLTHFLGSGGVQEQLKTGAYEVPGANMSVDGYTGKYNKFLQDNGGAKAMGVTGRNSKEYQGPQNDADLYAQQAAGIGMENVPYDNSPQANPFTAEVKRKIRPEIQADIDAFDGLLEGQGNPGGLQPMPYRENLKKEFVQKERPQPANILPEAQSLESEIERNPVKSMSAARIKNMLSPKETDYSGFQNLKRPTDNITEYAYGGSVKTEDSENFVAFEGGGTHEQNSLGGIPQGTGSNGKMNTVEEGETKVTIKGEEYIFSERGQLDGTGFEGTKSTNSYAMGGDPTYINNGLTAAGTGADAVAGAAGGAGGAKGAAGGGGMGIAGAAAGMTSMALDMVPEKNSENNTGVEGIQGQKSVGLGAAKGAASGAAAGAVAGPWGMAAGAVIGGAAGAITTSMGNKKARKENLEAYAQANPALQNQNYGGGYLKKKKKGGKMLNPSTNKSRVKAMLRK